MPSWWPGWPNGKKFAFVLTHDVEGSKGLNRCRELAEMEMAAGFRSSFNFIPEGEYVPQRSLRDFLAGRGFEIGVHDLRHDGKLLASQDKFERYAHRIDWYLREWGAVGFRSAFMLHDMERIGDLDIQYDSSRFDTDPFEPQPDGANTIFPFWVERNDGSGYVELPYTLAQDSTLFILLQESGIDIWIQKLNWVASHGGMALVNAHPDYMSFNGARKSREYSARLYQEFLTYTLDHYAKDAWFALPKEVASYVGDVRAASKRQRPSPSYACGLTVSLDATQGRIPARTPQRETPSDCDVTRAGEGRVQGRRVAAVTFSYYPGDPRPRRAAEALANMGMRVDVICLAETAKDVKREIVNGVNVRRISIKRRRGGAIQYAFQYSAFLLASAGVLAARSLTCSYDLVHVHNMPDFLVLCALIPKTLGAKVILDLHDPMPELMMTIFGLKSEDFAVRALKWIEKWSAKLADAVVTVNHRCAKLFTSRGCPSEKMNVVMNAPDERIFTHRFPHIEAADPPAAPQRPFRIMYHGSLLERNGLDLAVDAISRIQNVIPHAELRVYGAHTPFLARVLESVRGRGLQHVVQYLGPKSLEQIVSAINECHVGIIPNRRCVFAELNTPTRIFEYLTLGKPVIAPRSAGVCDYFAEGSIIFFELGDAEDLARKIEYVYSHPFETAETVRRGQEICLQHDWQSERRRFTALVDRLLHSDVIPVGSVPLESRSASVLGASLDS
ncbi:MAG: glycosyltransferase [Acidobacteriota bacterium]|nr:glycosyltransferase [Acidobacteriota bacterium]